MKTFLQKLRKHFEDWAELYFWLPLFIVIVQLASLLYFHLTGRKVVDDPWAWIVDLAPQIVKAVVAIVLTSIFVQQTSVWMSKEEQFQNPKIAIAGKLRSVLVLAVFVYALSH